MKDKERIFYHSEMIRTYDEEIQKSTEEHNKKIEKLTKWRNEESEKLFTNYFETL